MSIFVAMNDNFMSGWGPAKGKINVYVVECENQAQADQIKRTAAEREEMTRVRQVMHRPRNTRRVLVSLKHFSELGPIWTGEEEV